VRPSAIAVVCAIGLASTGARAEPAEKSPAPSPDAAAPAAPPSAAPPKRRVPSLVPTIALGVTGGVGIVLAIAGFAASVERAGHARSLAEGLRADGLTCNDRPEVCAEGDETLADKQAFEFLGVFGLVAGASSLTAMAIYRFVTSPKAPTPAPSPKVDVKTGLAPLPGGAFATITVSGWAL